VFAYHPEALLSWGVNLASRTLLLLALTLGACTRLVVPATAADGAAPDASLEAAVPVDGRTADKDADSSDFTSDHGSHPDSSLDGRPLDLLLPDLVSPLDAMSFDLKLAFDLSSQSSVKSFDYTGSLQTFTVPVGVTQIVIKAWGAGGGGDCGWPSTTFGGGGGGFAQATVSVSPGETLGVLVGGGGAGSTWFMNPGGFGGGGDGVGGTWFGHGGGGRSEVSRGNTPLVIAGGGGGGGGRCPSTGHGGKGGGGDGGDENPGNGGGGGTQTAGGLGAGGAQDGSARQGGDGATTGGFGGGGGGGGGYFGGGGGANDTNGSGGGGGSNFVSGSKTTSLKAQDYRAANTGDSDYKTFRGRGGNDNDQQGKPGYIVIRW
jgi:hypothetical protein